MRYGKFQSTAGVEDAARVPQGKLMKWIPTVMDLVVNLNRSVSFSHPTYVSLFASFSLGLYFCMSSSDVH